MQKLLDTISQASRKGYTLEEINEKLKNAKNKNVGDLDFFIKIIPSTKQIVIDVQNNEVYLSLKKSVGENADKLYTKGKKFEKKTEGTTLAIERTKSQIQKLLNKKQLVEKKIDFLIKKPRKRWFEKFRWFFTSDGFLVIGGRDAVSNELIFRKYIHNNDLVFHTNFHGSPLTLIKNPENKEILENTIKETANFVASYSRAWKENWGVVDVFYVSPDQISKSPPSGEFLSKGSFMISGKKNFLNNAKTELAISIDFIELKETSNIEKYQYYPKIIVGPISAIKSKHELFLIIKPSNTGLQKGALAKEIKSFFVKSSPKKLKKWVKLLSLDDIILVLPSGKSIIEKQS